MFYCVARSNRQTTAIPNLIQTNQNSEKKKNKVSCSEGVLRFKVANIPQNIL